MSPYFLTCNSCNFCSSTMGTNLGVNRQFLWPCSPKKKEPIATCALVGLYTGVWADTVRNMVQFVHVALCSFSCISELSPNYPKMSPMVEKQNGRRPQSPYNIYGFDTVYFCMIGIEHISGSPANTLCTMCYIHVACFISAIHAHQPTQEQLTTIFVWFYL